MKKSSWKIVLAILLAATAIVNAATFDSGGINPRDQVVSPDGQYLYVACQNGIVTKVRISDYAILDTVFVGYDPWNIAITPDGQYLYVTNTVNGYYTSKIEVSSFTKLLDIRGGTDPAELDFTPDGSIVAITSHWSPFLQLVSVVTDEELGRIYGISTGGYDVVVTPDGDIAYVLARSGGPNPGSGLIKVSLLSNTVLDTIPILGGYGIDITPDGNEIWVPGLLHSNFVYVISTLSDTVIDSIEVGVYPIDVKISPDGQYAYVTNNFDRTVSKISVQNRSVVGIVGTGEYPRNMAISPDGSKLFVANNGENSITEINLIDQTIWCDDFEQYEVQTSPEPTWFLGANPNVQVDGTVAAEGAQSLRMTGALGGFFGATATRPTYMQLPIEIEMWVRNGTGGPLGNTRFRAKAALKTTPNWWDPGLELFQFHENGDFAIQHVPSMDEQVFSGYMLEQWYRIRMTVYAPGDGDIHVQYWIDELYLGEFSTRDTYSTSLPHIMLVSAEREAWFDDVCVQSGISVGSICALVNIADDPQTPAEGVSVTILDENNNPVVDPQQTDENGEAYFDSLDVGEYSVMIVTPLGYSVSPSETQTSINVTSGDCMPVNFVLTPIIVSNNCRTIGYWKHQFNVYTNNRGNAQESAADLETYLDLVHQHFNVLGVYVNLEYFNFEDAKNILTVRGGRLMLDRAKQQLFALLLNFASGRIGNETVVSEDGQVAAEAVTLVADLITDGDPANDEIAKSICDLINNGQMVESGIIPESSVRYKLMFDGILPKVYSLSQNYPNPFNASTTIKYNLPITSEITIDIYDILGRKVETLVNKQQQAGYHQAIWNADDKTSGMYFYMIQAGEYSEAKKMMLLK